MGRKQYILLGLAGVLVGLGMAGVLLWPKVARLSGKMEKKTIVAEEEKKSEAQVISWQPDTATLIYQDEKQQSQTVAIQPMKPIVIVRVYEGDKFVKEELALTPIYAHWQKAFCPGGKLVLTFNQDEGLKEIRNKGLRRCSN